MNGMEYAAGSRNVDTYPDEWGTPAGRQFSEERAAWVKERVYSHSRDPQVKLRQLADADRRLAVTLRMAELQRRLG
jgi:hypothetical protein